MWAVNVSATHRYIHIHTCHRLFIDISTNVHIHLTLLLLQFPAFVKPLEMFDKGQRRCQPCLKWQKTAMFYRESAMFVPVKLGVFNATKFVATMATWYFPDPNHVVFVPQLTHSISTTLWQKKDGKLILTKHNQVLSYLWLGRHILCQPSETIIAG